MSDETMDEDDDDEGGELLLIVFFLYRMLPASLNSRYHI
jgi:hypothetical protein